MNVLLCVWVYDSETGHYGCWFVSGCQCRSWGHNSPVHTACPDRGHWPSSPPSHLAAFMQDTGKSAERKWGMERWRKGEFEEEKEGDGWGRLLEGWSILVIGVIREISHITGWWFRWFCMGRTNAGIQVCQKLRNILNLPHLLRYALNNRTEIIIHGESPVYSTLVGVFQKHSGLVLSKCINLMNHRFSKYFFLCHILKLSIIWLCMHGRTDNSTARFHFRSIVHQDVFKQINIVWMLLKCYPGDFLILNTAQMDFLKEEPILGCIYLIKYRNNSNIVK